MGTLNGKNITTTSAKGEREGSYSVTVIDPIPLDQARREAGIMPEYVGRGRDAHPAHIVAAGLDGTPEIVTGVTPPSKPVRRGAPAIRFA